MDLVPAVLTDRFAAAGWRLAGANVRVVTPEGAASAFEEACATAPLVLVDAALARELDSQRLAAARRATRPLVFVVPALSRRSPVAGEAHAAVPDVAASLKRALGVAS
jgi:vacuolar-type H+-ATPase subunit F/Vma7